MKILTCVGTRPNLIKITRLHECLQTYEGVEHRLLHTGQHFDERMNDVFFRELAIPSPDVFLGVQAGSQISVITDIMRGMEQEILSNRPDWVLVPGDVNSSLACALVASRMGVKVAHIESGLRSYDKTMPEEVNRVIIDDLADLFFVTEPSGLQHLLQEGKSESKIHYTGNTMIDALVKYMPRIEASEILQTLDIEPKKYALLTFHRPANVDNEINLKLITQLIADISPLYKVVFPVHPRTMKQLEQWGLTDTLKNLGVILTEPLGYFDFIKLVKHSKFVLTDSGGVQEETTYLQVPCLTARPNTERPVTITEGSNTLLNLDHEQILHHIDLIKQGAYKQGTIPQYWDGKATERLCAALCQQV